MRTPNSVAFNNQTSLAPIPNKLSKRRNIKPTYREIKKPDLTSLDANMEHITAAAYNDESFRQSKIDFDSHERSTIDL